ncbi:MAG: MFS transporter [Deltaproteobacteria bacterium]|nr:MFS transporter [Deltaproteobacteria bacterium]
MASPLLPIFLTVLVDVLGMTLIFPLLPFYAEHYGATPLVVGALSASFAVCQLISGPILGRWSDRIGRKPVLVVSQVGTLLGFVVLAWAPSLPFLFLGRILDGLTAGNLTIAQAYISDVTKPEQRTKAFALIGIAFGLGFLVGPAASGWLAAHHGYAAPAWGAAGLALLSILTTTLILPHRPPTAPGPSRNFAFGKFFARPLPKKRLLEMFAYGLSFFTITGGLGLYLERQMGYDVEHTGYVYAFSGLVGALVQGGPIGKLAKRFGEEKLSLFAFATMALGYGLLGGVFGLGMLLVLVAVAGVGSALGRPSLTTLLTKAVGPEEQGAILGTSQSLMGVAQIIGPLLAGFLIGHRLLWAYGLAAAAFSLLGAGLRVLLSDGEPQLKAAPG